MMTYLILGEIIIYLNNIINNENNLIFFSFGCAINRYHNNINNTNYQCPPFIYKFMNLFPSKHVYIILVDPYLMYFPYIVQQHNKSKLLDNTKWKISQEYSNVYKHIHRNLTVIAFHDYVSYLPNINNHITINIYFILTSLNEFIINNKLLLIAHDFSTQVYIPMVFFFYDKIKNNLDRIIYHLGSQINDKYYTDFLKKENNIIFNNDMTMFNPYNPIYHSNDFYKTIINDNDKLIKFNNYLNDIVNIIVDIFVVQFEKFFVLLQNKNNNIITSDTDLFIMSHFSKTNC